MSVSIGLLDDRVKNVKWDSEAARQNLALSVGAGVRWVVRTETAGERGVYGTKGKGKGKEAGTRVRLTYPDTLRATEVVRLSISHTHRTISYSQSYLHRL